MATFEKDLFISYAHIDNPSAAEQEGWITQFHATLEANLSMYVGGKAQIWRDDKLQGKDVFDGMAAAMAVQSNPFPGLWSILRC